MTEISTNVLGFFEAPRAVGDPFQVIMRSQQEILDFIESRSGKKPVFVSHNSYPTIINGGEPYQIDVKKLFFDFDSKNKPENAQLDVLKLLDFCEKENLRIYIAFSGSKGFHCYISLKSTVYLFGKYLKDATRAVHLWFEQKLGLRTIDMSCAEPKRLCRVWYTPHVSYNPKSGETLINGLYCCPLLPEWIRNWRMDQIIEFARAPQLIDYNPNGELLSLDEFIAKYEIDVEKILKSEFINDEKSRNKIAEYIPVEDNFIKLVLPFPCIHNQIVHNPNPPHLVRFAAVVWLKRLGYTREWILNFFLDRNYIDRKVNVCCYQINQIYDHNPPYKFPACKKIFEDSMCVGTICPKYNDFSKRVGLVVY